MENDNPYNESSQFGLLRVKRFAPFFWTQFFGAFNDNIYRNVLIILIAYQSGQMISVDPNMLINLAAGLFIFPFFLFSATAGQLADKYEKSMLIRRIKLFEIAIMGFAAVAFYFHSVSILLILLFFMGTQSSFFGPVKYSIIPQHLKEGEIIGGNAMVEMGTFVSILLGTITGGVLGSLLGDTTYGALLIGAAICIMAFAGWGASCLIPKAEPPAPGLKINWNPIVQTWETIKFARKDRVVFLSILGISWFWFLGLAYQTQIPNFTRLVLKGSESVMILLLAMFSIGIGAGSLLCEWLSGRKIEIGLVPIGSIGLSIFGFDLFLAYETPDVNQLMGIAQFLQTTGSIRVLIDLLLIGIFGGFYIVPLYALIQTRSNPEYRSRIIAANNILNALFMVISSISAGVLLGVAKLTIPWFFMVLALANIATALYIYLLVPEFTMRCMVWLLTHVLYRIKHKNLHLIPDEGPAVIVCNHVSFVDALVIAGVCRRPARFVMDKAIFGIPVLNFIFRTGKAIPITSRRIDETVYNEAFDQISQELNEGNVICIFPEGKLTKDGEIDEFKAGIEKIIARNPVPVVPAALRGLWGSFFSYKGGPAMMRFPKRFFSKIEFVVGTPVLPEQLTASGLRDTVLELRGDKN